MGAGTGICRSPFTTAANYLVAVEVGQRQCDCRSQGRQAPDVIEQWARYGRTDAGPGMSQGGLILRTSRMCHAGRVASVRSVSQVDRGTVASQANQAVVDSAAFRARVAGDIRGRRVGARGAV